MKKRNSASNADDASRPSAISSQSSASADLGTGAFLGGSLPETLQVGGVEITAAYLQQESSFLEDVTIQLYQKLVEIYGEELDQEITSDTILTTIKKLAADWLDEQQLWQELAQEIRSNLVMRSLQDMERDLGDSMLQSLDWEAFNRLLLQYLANDESDRFKARLAQLEAHYAQRFANRIVQELGLEAQSIATLKRLLQITVEPPWPTSRALNPSPEAADVSPSTPSPIPQIPSEFPATAQEDQSGTLYFSDRFQSDLWEPDLRNIAFLRYQSKHHRNFYLEHYLLNPNDLGFLPWEMAEQILNKCGPTATTLHLLLGVYAAQQSRPWYDSFRVSVSDVVAYLYPDPAKGLGRADLHNQTAGLAYALSCLLIKLVLRQGVAGSRQPVQTPVGKLWDIVIQPEGMLDTATGRIEVPDEVWLTVRPGLWIEHLMQQAGGQFSLVLHQFGQLMLQFYQMGGFANPLALRLLVYLMLETRLQGSFKNPYEYQVRQLLMVAQPQQDPPETLALGELQVLFERWNQALMMLAQLGWRTSAATPEPRATATGAVPLSVFYLSPYPRWLDPAQEIRKPKGWVSNWLNQAIALYPPTASDRSAPYPQSAD